MFKNQFFVDVTLYSMIKNIFKVSMFLLLILLMVCCKSDRPPIKEITSMEDLITQPNKINKINKVNFYFENSLSMNGYLKGEKFRSSMAEIIYNFNEDSVSTFFVNTKAHKTSGILDKIRGNSIGVGDISNSDHKFIFTNAIKNAANNNLSIVVTDGIYSMSGGKLTLGDVEKDIEKAFENSLVQNELETVVLKIIS